MSTVILKYTEETMGSEDKKFQNIGIIDGYGYIFIMVRWSPLGVQGHIHPGLPGSR